MSGLRVAMTMVSYWIERQHGWTLWHLDHSQPTTLPSHLDSLRIANKVGWGSLLMPSKIRATHGAAAVVALSLAACASVPQLPPNAPAPLSAEERGGTPGIPYSDVIEAAGGPEVASEPVAPEGTLVTIPYRYKHTAVLTEDVVGFSITVPGVQAPRGSPGYYAGTFLRSNGAGAVGQPSELWCFVPSVVGGRRDHICLLQSGALAAIAPTRLNPYLWWQFAPATGTFDFVRAPIFERRDVEIPGTLRLEYRFEGWGNGTAHLAEFAGGREVRRLDPPLKADGNASVQTVAGLLTIHRNEPQSPEATVSLSRN
jgi:hypothetical protein